MYQEQYWKELLHLKQHINYVEISLRHSEKIDNVINIFLAIASSTSISAWVIWRDFPQVWAAVIALSQLIGAVKAHLPYSRRAKAFSGLLQDLEGLMLFAERKWYEVSEGLLDEKSIHKLRCDIKEKKAECLKRHFPSASIPEKASFSEESWQRTEDHFRMFYNIGESRV